MLRDHQFRTPEGAFGIAMDLKEKYGRDLVIVREFSGIYSICGVNYYIHIADKVELIDCTNPRLYGKWKTE